MKRVARPCRSVMKRRDAEVVPSYQKWLAAAEGERLLLVGVPSRHPCLPSGIRSSPSRNDSYHSRESVGHEALSHGAWPLREHIMVAAPQNQRRSRCDRAARPIWQLRFRVRKTEPRLCSHRKTARRTSAGNGIARDCRGQDALRAASRIVSGRVERIVQAILVVAFRLAANGGN
jgi:hypothetical protein